MSRLLKTRHDYSEWMCDRQNFDVRGIVIIDEEAPLVVEGLLIVILGIRGSADQFTQRCSTAEESFPTDAISTAHVQRADYVVCVVADERATVEQNDPQSVVLDRLC